MNTKMTAANWRRLQVMAADPNEAAREMVRNVLSLRHRNMYEEIDQLIELVETVDFGESFLVTLLIVTSPCAEPLKRREALYGRVLAKLTNDYGQACASEKLAGLS